MVCLEQLETQQSAGGSPARRLLQRARDGRVGAVSRGARVDSRTLGEKGVPTACAKDVSRLSRGCSLPKQRSTQLGAGSWRDDL